MSNFDRLDVTLEQWLLGMEIVAFDFHAGFRLRLERAEERSGCPQVLYLEVKARMLFDEEGKWDQFVALLPIKARRGEADEPALAYRLMLVMGAKVAGSDLLECGDLIISTSDNEKLIVKGTDDVWDDSWVLLEPDDLLGGGGRLLACDSQGNIRYNETSK